VQSVDAILVTVDPVRLALAEDAALEAQLMERSSGYDQPFSILPAP
jgi:hypothetical protein